MDGMELQELYQRISGMSDEEKRMAVSIMPSEILVGELLSRLSNYESRLKCIKEISMHGELDMSLADLCKVNSAPAYHQ